MITISDGILTIPEGERSVGFSGDNLHTQKKFFIRSTPESGWLYRLYLTFDDGRYNFLTLSKEEVKDGTFLVWNIEEGHILKSGLVKAQIKAFSSDNEVYHTTSDVFVAGKTTEEDEEFLNSYSEFLSLEKRLNQLYGKMENASAKMPYVGSNGNWFTYDVNSGTYKDSGTSAVVSLDGVKITPDTFDRTYWEYAKSSFVESASGLLDMLTEENRIMRIKALEGSSLYSQLGNHEAVVIKTEDGFLIFDLVTGTKYKFDPEGGGLKEIRKINDGDINSEYLFSEDMREKFLSLPVLKVTAEEFTVDWFNSQTTPGIYQASSQSGEHCVLIVLKPDTQIHLMQIKLSHGKLEYRSCLSDLPQHYFADCWTEWADLTAVDDIQEKLKSIEARLEGVELVSWKAVQDIVRSGRASEIFSVGDKFMCEHSEYGLLEWMVIGIDHDTPADESLSHSMTLMLDTPIPAGQYDGAEALFSVRTKLDVMSYQFSIDDTYVSFTPTAEVPVGAVIVFPYYDYSNLTDTPLYIYETPDDSEPMMTLAVSTGASGPPLKTYANQNDSYRAQYGSNNWAKSAIRQFLNSSASAGEVWTPQGDFDRPPKWADSSAGFLNGMDEDFLSVIGEVKKETLAVAFDNGENGLAESTEKFFLPSPVEVYAGDYRTGEIADGKPYDYYSQNSSNSANTIKDDKNRIVYYNGAAARAFLRSPLYSKNEEVCYINSAGAVNAVDANADYSSNNIVLIPCCCIV